ncbi:hypothetical protein SADUNF_Sadunf07G0065800 [Salix dunnii]|uniref:Pentatricopeptide repeat-containing protein n=1 Tax=Salix dunnii TaxID=1413687 RepID=A0A835JZK3_9ROSI|nr:hypothetical protein SADUNF_Sadunf07G0065800 [Salix dunnii]
MLFMNCTHHFQNVQKYLSIKLTLDFTKYGLIYQFRKKKNTYQIYHKKKKAPPSLLLFMGNMYIFLLSRIKHQLTFLPKNNVLASLKLFRPHCHAGSFIMLLRNPNLNLNRTLITFLDKCKSMLQLNQIHALVITLGLSQDNFFMSKIVSISASNNTDYSHRALLNLQEPTIFDWNTVIMGYSKSKNPNKSISVFVKMLQVGIYPDHLTYPFLAKATSRLLRKELGVSIHGHVIKSGFEIDRFVANSLIHMYGPCGDIVDVRSWSCLIDGYAKSGSYGDAMAVFEKMRTSGPKANEVTMVSVLCACAHLGALDKGRMMHRYMVDNGGCMNHRKLDLAELVGKKLIELDPEHDGRYIGLSNVYAIGRRWDEARITREAMERRGVKKTPGYSFLEMSGAHHRFIAHDESHPSSEHIYTMLRFIASQMQLDVLNEGQEHCLYGIEKFVYPFLMLGAMEKKELYQKHSHK